MEAGRLERVEVVLHLVGPARPEVRPRRRGRTYGAFSALLSGHDPPPRGGGRIQAPRPRTPRWRWTSSSDWSTSSSAAARASPRSISSLRGVDGERLAAVGQVARQHRPAGWPLDGARASSASSASIWASAQSQSPVRSASSQAFWVLVTMNPARRPRRRARAMPARSTSSAARGSPPRYDRALPERGEGDLLEPVRLGQPSARLDERQALVRPADVDRPRRA